MRYENAARGHHRAIRLHRDGETLRLGAYMLAGDTESQAWLHPMLRDGAGLPNAGAWLLQACVDAPAAEAASRATAGKQVCACFDVSDLAIQAALHAAPSLRDPAQRVHHVQASLKCGTGCGSCVPTLRKMAASL